jgi:NIMA (never in mitosis gene a)-related kinase
MLDGLDFLHSKRVIHFDVKPKNIFLDKIERIKLGDLGIARNFQTLSTMPQLRGTLVYMSPEVIKEENIDFKTDIWSFGCVLYELITLQPLFTNNPIFFVLGQILTMKIQIPDNLHTDLAFLLNK